MRTYICIAALSAVCGFAATAEAVFFDDSVHYVKHGCRENNLWPWPYVCADRVAVHEPFCMMINNGWRRQNLLGPHYFNSDSSQLTTAGELRVRWIMTQAPASRRMIFVERDLAPSITEQRMATVREYAAQVAMDGQVPQILETHLVSEGRPASVVDATNVRFQESLPPPTLPASTAGVTSGTGQ